MTVMSVASSCWRLYDDESSSLMTDLRCWWQNHYVGDFFQCIKSVTNLHPNFLHLKLVTNTVCLQHPSPTSMSPLIVDKLVQTFHNLSSMKWIIIPEPKTMSPFTCSSKKIFANALSVDHGRFINKCASIGRFIRYKYRIMRINRS